MLWVIIILLGIILDQVTKYIVFSNMSLGQSITIIENFLYITYWENRGAAWGILQNQRWLFISLTIIMTIAMLYFLKKLKHNLVRVALSFIISGAIGNLIDRIYRGSVVDFINTYLFRTANFDGYDFPIFNVADSCVTIGTVLLSVYILFIYKEPEKPVQETISEQQPDAVNPEDTQSDVSIEAPSDLNTPVITRAQADGNE